MSQIEARWREWEPLQPLLSMRLQQSARYYCEVACEEQLTEAVERAQQLQLPVLLLAGGSNLVPGQDWPGLCVRLCSKGWQLLDEDDDSALVEAAAGEDLQQLLAGFLRRGWYGMENLSSIPGSLGAAPVQNVGAYGQEIAEVTQELLVWEQGAGQARWVAAQDCGFGYRTSRFRHRHDCHILRLRLRLRRKPQPCLAHPALAQRFTGQEPHPREVAAEVAAIRAKRLPDWRTEPNVGSFFVNPVVPPQRAEELRERLPDLPHRPQGQGVQLAAARLIEELGLRGLRRGKVGVSQRHALVLVNHADATGAEVLALADEVRDKVAEAWGLQLAIEPRVV